MVFLKRLDVQKKFYYVAVHMAPLLYFKDLELEIELFLSRKKLNAFMS